MEYAGIRLDEAWEDAEAVLPGEWRIAALDFLLPHDSENYVPTWTAEANRVENGRWSGESIEGQGDNPVAALMNLAMLLRRRRRDG